MRSDDNPGRKNSPAKRSTKRSKAPEPETSEPEVLYDDIMGAFLVKYDINDKGIGHISLPPSLSMLLQSDQIYISPSAGGLFIRSV